MSAKELSPEERLLALIKKRPEDKTQGGASLPSAAELHEKATVCSRLPGRASPCRPIVKAGLNTCGFINLFNKGLVILLILSSVCAVFAYIYPYKSDTKVPDLDGIKNTGSAGKNQPRNIPSLSHYTGILGGRNLFKLYQPPRERPKGPVKPKVTLSQLLAGYTFVGIIFGDTPQAIVEEKKSGQSYYLSSGGSLGEIKIEKVEKGCITVSHDDETMEIKI